MGYLRRTKFAEIARDPAKNQARDESLARRLLVAAFDVGTKLLQKMNVLLKEFIQLLVTQYFCLCDAPQRLLVLLFCGHFRCVETFQNPHFQTAKYLPCIHFSSDDLHAPGAFRLRFTFMHWASALPLVRLFFAVRLWHVVSGSDLIFPIERIRMHFSGHCFLLSRGNIWGWNALGQ